MLQPFNAFSHVVVTPNHKIISLLPPNCKVATVVNCNVNICYATTVKGSFNPKEVITLRLRTTTLEYNCGFRGAPGWLRDRYEGGYFTLPIFLLKHLKKGVLAMLLKLVFNA